MSDKLGPVRFWGTGGTYYYCSSYTSISSMLGAYCDCTKCYNGIVNLVGVKDKDNCVSYYPVFNTSYNLTPKLRYLNYFIGNYECTWYNWDIKCSSGFSPAQWLYLTKAMICGSGWKSDNVVGPTVIIPSTYAPPTICVPRQYYESSDHHYRGYIYCAIYYSTSIISNGSYRACLYNRMCVYVCSLYDMPGDSCCGAYVSACLCASNEYWLTCSTGYIKAWKIT